MKESDLALTEVMSAIVVYSIAVSTAGPPPRNMNMGDTRTSWTGKKSK